MDFIALTEDERQAILNQTAGNPSKNDLLTQIEADYLVAERAGDTDACTALDAKHQAVSSAATDSEAREAYEA